MDFMMMAAAAMITVASTGSSSSRDFSDRRVRPIVFQLRSSDAGDRATIASIELSPRDELAATRRRRHAARFTAGPVTLSLVAARMRSARPDTSSMPADRLSLMSLAGALGIELGTGTSLSAFVATARVKRRFAAFSELRALGSDETVVGLSLVRRASGTVTLEYHSVGVRGERDAAMRIVERLGGAIPAGYGPRLAFSTAAADERAGGIAWTLSAASLHRQPDHGTMASRPGSVEDRRIEVAMRMAL